MTFEHEGNFYIANLQIYYIAIVNATEPFNSFTKLRLVIYAVLVLTPVFSLAQGIQKSLYVHTGVQAVIGAGIIHNPLNKVENEEILRSPLSFAPFIGLGSIFELTSKSSLDINYSFGRIPYKLKIVVNENEYDLPNGYTELFHLGGSRIIRNNRLRMDYRYLFSKSNSTMAAGISLNAISTFRTTQNYNLSDRDSSNNSQILIFRNEAIDNPDYQTNRNSQGKSQKIYLGFHLGVSKVFNKPASEVSLSMNYIPVDVGFGAFEFYNIGVVSEGYFNIRASSLSVDYKFKLANLRRKK
jgi:hypothetical protein